MNFCKALETMYIVKFIIIILQATWKRSVLHFCCSQIELKITIKCVGLKD